uniref:Uncharacterized protein n=1 Tax=Arundo donax TaxID=35708 RepID=A0A0A9CFR4_ARUDO
MHPDCTYEQIRVLNETKSLFGISSNSLHAREWRPNDA